MKRNIFKFKRYQKKKFASCFCILTLPVPCIFESCIETPEVPVVKSKLPACITASDHSNAIHIH